MVYEVNQEAIDQYKKRFFQVESERYYGADFLPGTDPATPTRKFGVITTTKKTKVPGDRSLRVDDWVGGYTVQDQKPKHRTWKVKAHVPAYTYEDNFLFKGG